MFTNTYDITMNKDGEEVTARLRLTIGAQIQLKKRFNEPTKTTLFNAPEDPERLVALFDHALKWQGNDNAVKSGEELLNLMADNNMLGMLATQKHLTALGVASGLFSASEADSIDRKAAKMFDDVLDDESNTDSVKNA